MKILKAEMEDAQTLCDIFFEHIESHTEYISHGEIQMGVGEGTFVNEKLIAYHCYQLLERLKFYNHSLILRHL